jgi:hypothetical protein
MAALADILNNQGESLVCHNHIQQQLTFCVGSGIEFLPLRDDGGVRKAFIDSIAKASRLQLKLDGMFTRLMKDGRILLYLRPVGRTYKLEFYRADQYRVYQDAAGDVESCKIRYTYKVDENGVLRDRWVLLYLTSSLVEFSEHENRPSFEEVFTPANAANFSATENPLGVVPVREVLNPAPANEEMGRSDFEALQSRIEAHDDITSAIIDNLTFYCNSPILTSRSAGEVSEAMGFGSEIDRDSVAYASGFRTAPGESPQNVAVGMGGRRRKRLKKIIGDVDENDRFQQLQVDAVSPDHAAFADAYERQLRESLGGILERNIETATESRVVYGKVAATAFKKQTSLFTYGICELLELAIYCEEKLYQASEQTIGLAPIHPDRSVLWRAGPVYQESAESLNYRSITARNLAKFFGVSPKSAIKYVFPDKADNEIEQMVADGGFPSDYLQTAIAMFGQLAQTIDPLTGGVVSDPQTGLPLAYNLLPFIINNLNYGRQFTTPATPTNPNPAAEQRADIAAIGRFAKILAGLGVMGTATTGADVQQSAEPPAPGVTLATRANTGFWSTNFPTFTAIADSIRGTFNR